MPQKFNNKYRIPSARATWHDYNGGLYFITICTKGMEHYFGKIQDNEMIYTETGKYAEKCISDIPNHFADAEIIISQVMPNHVHLIVEIQNVETMHASSDKSTKHAHTVKTMHASSDESTKHAHTVETMHASSLQPPRWKNEICDEKMHNISNKRGRISYVIGSFKSAVTKFANENNKEFGWQSRFHDHIIRSQAELERIYEYIQNNVTTWNNDRFNSHPRPS